jgi:hypothetical protein
MKKKELSIEKQTEHARWSLHTRQNYYNYLFLSWVLLVNFWINLETQHVSIVEERISVYFDIYGIMICLRFRHSHCMTRDMHDSQFHEEPHAMKPRYAI